jgi:trk system potassium uptake protein TrkH
MSELSSAGKVWMCGLMIVGGSPGSTAGGMKTVTVVVLLAGTWSVLRRRREVELFRRSLGEDLVRKALAVAVLYLLLLAAVTILLAVSMRDAPLVNVFFEACSACGTVGLSTGVTGQGHFLMTRAVTIAAMFLGRVGPITGMLALTSGLRTSDYSYPREPVQLG